MKNRKEEVQVETMIITVNQAVEISGLSRHKILELIKNDPKFPYFKVGAHYRINREMLKDYLVQATKLNKSL